MLTSSISNTCRCHSVGVSCNFVWTLVFWIDWQMLLSIDVYYVWKYGRCYCQPYFCGRCLTHCCSCLMELTWGQMLWPWLFMWLMLLSLIYWHGDWCYCHCWCWICLADVIANVGNHFNCCKGTCPWLMLLPLWLVRLMLLPLWCF